MPRFRRIDMPGCTSGNLGAVTALLAHEAFEGTFEPTCVVFRFSYERPTITFSAWEDGDSINAAVASARGHVAARRLFFGGGTGIFYPDLPFIIYYHREPYRKPDLTLHAMIDRNGEANAAALRRLGFPVEYRTVGDLEVVLDGTRVKVGANSAANGFLPDFWGTNTCLIWSAVPPASLETVGAATVLPPEKFEDKQTKSYGARMFALDELAARLGLSVTLEAAIDAAIDENARVIGVTPEPDRWTGAEQSFIDRATPFFEGEIWHNRVSSRRLAQRSPADCFIGQAAYKSRKLIKATVVVERSGEIRECLFAGDAFLRPGPTVTSPGLFEELGQAVWGQRADDEKGLLDTLTRILERPGVEVPLVPPADFLAALLRAGERRQPIATFLQGAASSPA